MPWDNKAADEGLDGIAGTGTTPTWRLHTGVPTIGASGNELSGNGYAAVQPGLANITKETNNNTRRLRVTAEMDFGDPTSAWAPTHVGLWDGSGASAERWGYWAISPGSIDQNTTKVFYAADTFIVGFGLQ